MTEVLSKSLELRGDMYAWARDWKKRTGGSAIGFFCCYAPEELIHAAGALPVRITGENRVVSKSGAHLQSYCCSLARTALDTALDGELAFLDGTVFTHTCDTMQRLSDIWRLNAGFVFHADVVLPVRFEGKLAEEYMYKEIASFKEKLEGFLGPIEADKLSESIKLYNHNRELLSTLYLFRRENPGVVSSDVALWLVASSALMDKKEHNLMLEEVLGVLGGSNAGSAAGSHEARDQSRGSPGEKISLFGIGSVMDQWDFLKMLEDAGGTFVDDDFCTGHRYFDTQASEDGDPLMSLARRMLDRASCPCKHFNSRDRSMRVVDRVTESGAKGVIFFQFKFCEPHAFDYPYLKEAFDDRGIPSLLLEIEQGSVSIEQLRTRLEALLETIRET